jgi:hypothetical protein
VVVAVVMAGLVGMGVAPQRAQAFVSVYVSIAVNIAATFNIGSSHSAVLQAIEQARREIIAEINASEARILAHIDGTEAGHVATCIRSSNQLLRGMDNPELQGDYGERINQANFVSNCAHQAGEMSRRVATLQVADYLGYATAEANAIAMVMRAWAGLDLESQLATYISDYARLLDKLRPTCTPRVFENERWIERVWTCTAFNGRTAVEMERRNTNGPPGEWIIGPVDVEALKVRAAADTSYALAWQALPDLHRSFAMVRRDFFVATAGDYLTRDRGVESGQVRYWHQDGPLSWVGLGNPGRASAVAAAIDVNDRRHFVAVLDGQVHHRVRTRDGSWSAWSALPHGGTATEVTVAVRPDGQAEVAAVIDGQIWHRVRTSETAWTPWWLLGRPGTVTALGSAIFGGGFHLAAVVDGQVRKIIRVLGDGSWTGWEDLGHAGTATSVAAVADPQGIFQLAAVVDGQFRHRGWYSSSGWTPWGTGNAPGTASEVTGAVDPAGNVQWAVVSLNPDRGLPEVLLWTRFPTGGWSDQWVRLGIDDDTFVGISGIAAS